MGLWNFAKIRKTCPRYPFCNLQPLHAGNEVWNFQTCWTFVAKIIKPNLGELLEQNPRSSKPIVTASSSASDVLTKYVTGNINYQIFDFPSRQTTVFFLKVPLIPNGGRISQRSIGRRKTPWKSFFWESSPRPTTRHRSTASKHGILPASHTIEGRRSHETAPKNCLTWLLTLS